MWNIEQIKSHIEVIPEGVMAAICHGILVGTAASLLIDNDGKPHTWYEVSDNGYIRNTRYCFQFNFNPIDPSCLWLVLYIFQVMS
jgi:hypothetical protein